MHGMTYILKYNNVMHEFINVPTSIDVRDGSGESERDTTMSEEPKVLSYFAFLAFYREMEGKIFMPCLGGTYIHKRVSRSYKWVRNISKEARVLSSIFTQTRIGYQITLWPIWM